MALYSRRTKGARAASTGDLAGWAASALDGLPEAAAVAVGDPPCVVYANAAFAALYGETPAALAGRAAEALGSEPGGRAVELVWLPLPVPGARLGLARDLSKARALEEFAYAAAHDLRAPLRRIDGFSGILAESHAAGLGPEGADLLKRVRRNIQDMGALIDSLLALGGLARAEPRVAEVDLTAMAREIAVELRRDHPQRQVEWVIADGLGGRGDAAMLRIALYNLLENALKFSARRPRARIELGRAGPRDGKQVFFVRDDGAGFDMAHKEMLFKAFRRLHRRDEFPGSGLGLATVERILSRHGGSVWLESEPERGTTVFFSLGRGPAS